VFLGLENVKERAKLGCLSQRHEREGSITGEGRGKREKKRFLREFLGLGRRIPPGTWKELGEESPLFVLQEERE